MSKTVTKNDTGFVKSRCKKTSLTMNEKKNKVMTNSKEVSLNVNVNGEDLLFIKEYVYEGHLIFTTDCMSRKIKRRVATTGKCYWSLLEVMKNPDLNIKHKRQTLTNSRSAKTVKKKVSQLLY